MRSKKEGRLFVVTLALAGLTHVGCSGGTASDSRAGTGNTGGMESSSGGGASTHGGNSAASAGASAGVGGASTTSTGGTGDTQGGTVSSTAGTGEVSSGGGHTAAAQPFKGVAGSSCAARALLGVSWYYNWTQKAETCSGGTGSVFVPMIWGHAGAEQTIASIRTSIAGFVTAGYKSVLGFNEPDNMAQSNITVDRAITLLPAFDNAAIAVGTPVTAANAAGQTWFKSYMADVAANSTLRTDFIALHWYGWNAGSCNATASQLESYIEYAEGFPGNRPIWLTEWGCLNQSAPSSAGVLAFYQGALVVFAKHPRVVRYAWYPWSTNLALNNSDGTLTELGKAYAAAPATK